MKAGIVVYSDGHRARYEPFFSLAAPLKDQQTPLAILFDRLLGIPGFSKPLLLVSDAPEEDGLIEEAEQRGIASARFSLNDFKDRPFSFSPERWGLPIERVKDRVPGTAIADLVKKNRWEDVLVVPLGNLLVDRSGIQDSFKLHKAEGFDATFSEDRLVGANWAIFSGDLLLGLQAQHPEIMQMANGFLWALKKPLYPFKIGSFQNPRGRALLSVNMHLSSPRVMKVLLNTAIGKCSSQDFSYNHWLLNSEWARGYSDAGPQLVYLEPSNNCPGKCFACPNPFLKRPRGEMTLDLFQKAAHGLVELHDARWVIAGMGEPLLNGDLPSMAEALHQQHLTLHTSLNVDPPPNLKMQHFDLIRLSVDALEQESFEKFRPGCSWKKVQDFINRAGERKAENPEEWPEIGVSFLKHEQNAHQAANFLRYWKNICTPPFRQEFFQWPPREKPEPVQWYQLLGCSDYLEILPYHESIRYTPLKRRPCSHALSGLHILWDGTVVLCPFDIEGRFPLGDLKTSSPMEIWESEKSRTFRKQHLELNFDQNLPCHSCQDWYHKE